MEEVVAKRQVELKEFNKEFGQTKIADVNVS